MIEWSEEIERGFEQQRLLIQRIAEVNASAVRIQHELGGLIRAAKGQVNPKNTFEPRIEAFKKTQLVDGCTSEMKASLVNTLLGFVEYRNRLTHDEWMLLMPRGTIPEGSVTGQGERHLTSTDMTTIGLITEAFAGLASLTGEVSTEVFYREHGHQRKTPLTQENLLEELASIDQLHREKIKPNWRSRVALSEAEEAALLDKE